MVASRAGSSARSSRRSDAASAVSSHGPPSLMKQMKNRSCSDRMSRPAFWAMLTEIFAFLILIPTAMIYLGTCKSFSLVMVALGFLMFYMIVPQLVPLKICRPFRIHSYTKKLIIWGAMAITVILGQYIFADKCIGWYWYGMALSLPAFLFLAASLRPPTEQSRAELRSERNIKGRLPGGPSNPHTLGSPIFDAFNTHRPSSRQSSERSLGRHSVESSHAHSFPPKSTSSRSMGSSQRSSSRGRPSPSRDIGFSSDNV